MRIKENYEILHKISLSHVIRDLLRQARPQYTRKIWKYWRWAKNFSVSVMLELCSLLVEILFRLRGIFLSGERSHFVIDVYLKYFLWGKAEMDCYWNPSSCNSLDMTLYSKFWGKSKYPDHRETFKSCTMLRNDIKVKSP